MPAPTVQMTDDLRGALTIIAEDFLPKPAGYAAKPYVTSLLELPNGATSYYEDEVRWLLVYLVGNLRGWRGPLASNTKAALKLIMKEGNL